MFKKAILIVGVILSLGISMNEHAKAAAVSMPAEVINTTQPLSQKEMSVSLAYLALFGRAPDIGGLNYWGSGLGNNATVVEAVNHIASGMKGANIGSVRDIIKENGSYVSPQGQDFHQFIEYLYAHLLGKSVEDDKEGVNYWISEAKSSYGPGKAIPTPGHFVKTILDVAPTAPGAAGALVKNRLTMLEAIVRMQKANPTKTVNYQDTITLIRRVVDTDASFNDAFIQLKRIINGGAAPTSQWEQPGGVSYTATKVLNESISLKGGTQVRAHKYLVWYNRSGRMMLAHVFLPSGYSAGGYYSTIISLHGGGWREGLIEMVQKYNTALTQPPGTPSANEKKYIVFSPDYQLTALGTQSPTQQHDAEDFLALVKNSWASFAVNPNDVNLFGLSAGGHLVNFLGSKTNSTRVASLYPEIDLTHAELYAPTAAVVPGMTSHIGYYAPTEQLRRDSSVMYPGKVWNYNGSKFFILHGDADTLVPLRQSTYFRDAINTASNKPVTVCTVVGGGHGYYDEYALIPADLSTFNRVINNVRNFFANPLTTQTPCL